MHLEARVLVTPCLASFRGRRLCARRAERGAPTHAMLAGRRLASSLVHSPFLSSARRLAQRLHEGEQLLKTQQDENKDRTLFRC
jgi:hypothetical protein